MSRLHDRAGHDELAELSSFRGEFYSCLTKRGDALFELADAVRCAGVALLGYLWSRSRFTSTTTR
ncbi:hypothetical protein OG689_31395 [Kitasatospora sp. NBC_00240]|uniref:hypothetical protein n=1 Tax=Kitasatospora sp. NBC_00240 TaxID=2903567 RepID=UPI0022528782|nr:hypothetical protein [Kitasatospora sp. NBC_00240]MCX5213723.1 hypothetical protein [Kitasatospora sp. NBC_00240]